MAIHRALAVVSEVVAELEQERGLLSVETVVEGNPTAVRARVEVPVSPCDGSDDEAVDPVDATLTADRELQVSYGPGDAVLPTVEGAPVEVAGREVFVRETVGIVARLDLRITPPDRAPPESGPSAAVNRQADERVDPVGDRSEAAGGDGESTGAETPAGGARDAADADSSGMASEDDRGPDNGATEADDGTRTAGEPTDEAGARAPAAGDATDRSGDGQTDLAARRDRSVPPYEDEPYLRALYEHCDTFASMRDAIEMDVSAETVRRYMIQAGIHDPVRYDTGEDAATDDLTGAANAGQRANHADVRGGTEADPPPEVADVREALELEATDIELPEEIEMPDLVDAVVSGRSTHEVARELNLGQEATRDLLRRLDLVDFVSYRLTEAADHETPYETVVARLRQGGAEVA